MGQQCTKLSRAQLSQVNKTLRRVVVWHNAACASVPLEVAATMLKARICDLALGRFRCGVQLLEQLLTDWSLVMPSSETGYNATVRGLKQLGVTHVDPGRAELYTSPDQDAEDSKLQQLMTGWLEEQRFMARRGGKGLLERTAAILIIDATKSHFQTKLSELKALGLQVIVMNSGEGECVLDGYDALYDWSSIIRQCGEPELSTMGLVIDPGATVSIEASPSSPA